MNGEPGSSGLGRLACASAVGIALVAALRCVILFAPQVLFDVDPGLDPNPIAGLGPAGSLVLDVALIVLCGLALAGQVRRPCADGVLLLLALAPLPIVLRHGWSDAGDLWRGATWFAAALAAATIAHVSRATRWRPVLIAILLAATGPVLVRGAANVTFEHADTIAQYEAGKEAFLQGRGWAPDSAQTRIFERRLRQRQPTGWFVTTNVFGSVAAAVMVASLGLVVASVRRRESSGTIGALTLLTAVAGAGVVMTGSKGAIGAAAGGGGLLVVVTWLAGRPRTRAIGPALAVGAVVLAIAAVAVRGVVLPESFAGERSLLFRWHYLESAAGIVRDHPIAGVGPDGFQTAYMRHRVARNPEEVASAHNVFADWLAALGVAGVAWVALALVLAARTGAALVRPRGSPEPELAPAGRDANLAIIGCGAAVLFGAAIVEQHVLDPLALAVRGLGVLSFATLCALLLAVLPRLDAADVSRALACAVVVLLVHAQIEMTLAQPGPVVWGMVLLGVSGAGGAWGSGGPARWSIVARLAPIAAFAAAGWLLVAGVLPAVRAERVVRQAAAVIAADPASPQARLQAAALLREAGGARRSSADTHRWAAEQTLIAAAVAPESERAALLEQAIGDLEAAQRVRPIGPATARAVGVHRALAGMTDDGAHAQAALDLSLRLAEADPHGLESQRRLADVLWERGEHDEARDVYRRVLEIDEQYSLDPLKQLSGEERGEIEGRVDGP